MQNSTFNLKVGMIVFLGTSNHTRHIITKIVNEFQVKVTNKREYDKGNDADWIVDVTSLRLPIVKTNTKAHAKL
jgi:ribosomal silencing factor RsfS